MINITHPQGETVRTILSWNFTEWVDQALDIVKDKHHGTEPSGR